MKSQLFKLGWEVLWVFGSVRHLNSLGKSLTLKTLHNIKKIAFNERLYFKM